jgi:hypothetical protein
MSTVASIITLVRVNLNELAEITDGFWTDAQIAAWIDKGARDLWRAINDLQNQDYFLTVDATNVASVANTEALAGVPADVGIVRGLEPRSLSSYPNLNFENAAYNSTKFQRARREGAVSPSNYGGMVYYAVTGAGAPVAAPTIRIGPTLDAAVLLRLSYAPTLATITKTTDPNPIPGESDNALAAWATAYAKGKETEEGLPDPGWLTIYGTEKQNLLVSLTPRADEDDTVAEAFFEDEWQ